MSSKRWMCGLAAAVVLTAVAGRASAEPPDPAWKALEGHAVVVERQDASLVAGKLVVVEEGSVEVVKPDGSRAVVERSAVKALRARLKDTQVTVTMKETEVTLSGKLAERDATTIVVTTDDGRRVTVDRASIETVRHRFPTEPAVAAPRPAKDAEGGDRARKMTEPSFEERPSTGLYLIWFGAATLGIGMGTMAAAALCEDSTCVRVRLSVGGGIGALGTMLFAGGLVQQATYNAWKLQHFGTVAFVPTRAGGTVTWQRTF